jgi:hypothetical protein
VPRRCRNAVLPWPPIRRNFVTRFPTSGISLRNMNALAGWENFYVIVGSSAGALIGLQFVVMTLIAQMPASGSDEQAGAAFGTPNVVHFCVVLLLSTLVSAPWQGVAIVAVLWGILGIVGVVYALVVAKRMRSQTVYRPVFEDWLFHALLPLIAYAMLAVSACIAFSRARPALFVVGAAAVLLLFIGIHNAWDTVVYQVFVRKKE